MFGVEGGDVCVWCGGRWCVFGVEGCGVCLVWRDVVCVWCGRR